MVFGCILLGNSGHKCITMLNSNKKCYNGGVWVAELIEHLTFDFGSGHDLMLCETDSQVGLYTELGACLGFFLSLSLSPSLCPSPTLTHSLALKNKK